MTRRDHLRRIACAPLWRHATTCLVAIAWFASGWLSVVLTHQANGLAAVWPSNAILLAALLLVRPGRWPAFIATTFVASTVIASIVGHVGLLAAAYGAVNVAEATLTATILRGVGFRGHLLGSLRGVLWFIAACAAACACSATVGVGVLMWRTAGSTPISWTAWFASDVLGFLILAPILLIGYDLVVHGGNAMPGRRLRLEGPLVLGTVALTTGLIFRQHTFPLLFMIYPPVLIATYRLRAPGAAAAVLIVAAIGLWGTAHGEGPVMMIRAPAETRMFFFQFYVAFLFMSTLPLATLLGDLDAMAAAKHMAEAELRAAAERAASEARILAATDELTGLCNRREFFRCLNDAMEQARVGGHPLGLALFDVDHFKQINDCVGHAGGDLVLKRLAGATLAAVRASDVVGRIGGEEFGVLLPAADIAAAAAVSERLRRGTEALRPENGVRVTVSIGLAMYDPATDADTLLARADEALYAAKRAGRNRLELAA